MAERVIAKKDVGEICATVFRNLALFVLFILFLKIVVRVPILIDYSLLLIALVLFGILALVTREKQKRGVSKSVRGKTWFSPTIVWVLVVLLVLGGFVYRAYDLSHDSYWIDESYTVLAAKNIAEYGVPQFDSGEFYSRAIPHSYLLFVVGELFGYGHVPMRALSVVAGAAFILVMFLMTRRLYDTKTALLTTFFVAFSYYQIAWSRQARMYIFLELFFYLSIYVYLLLAERYTTKRVVWLVILLAVAALFHPMALLLIPVFIVHYLLTKPRQVLLNIKEWTAQMQQLIAQRTVLVFIIAAALTILLWILYAYVGNLQMEIDYSGPYARFVMGSYLLFLLLGVIGFFTNKHLKKNLVFALAGLGLFALVSFFVTMMNLRYLFLIAPILFLFASQGIFYVGDLWKKRAWHWVVAIIVVALLLSSSFLFLPKHSYSLEYGTPQPPFADAYEVLSTYSGPIDVLVVTQPAIAELYLRKADYWLAISYSGRGLNMERVQEKYTGIPIIRTQEALEAQANPEGTRFLVIDDMGLHRLDEETRAYILSLPLVSTHGTEYWSTVYVYRLG